MITENRRAIILLDPKIMVELFNEINDGPSDVISRPVGKPMPKDLTFVACNFDPMRQVFILVVASEELEPIPANEQLPILAYWNEWERFKLIEGEYVKQSI